MRAPLPTAAAFAILSPAVLLAEPAPAPEDFADVSLEDLLNAEVAVTTKKPMSLRETPGIVTVIEAKEIRAYGARDLSELLLLVPGYGLGSDVEGVVGAAVRGHWAHEGKLLLLWDGQEMQDASFATVPFGNHFPLDQVARIEIIRGPGSVIYGGNAELAVVNVITKKATELQGVSASAHLGQQGLDPTRFHHRSLQLSAGHSFGDWSVVGHAAASFGRRSDRDFSDFYGDSYDLNRDNTMSSIFLNVGAQYQALSLRLIYDGYHTTQRDMFYANAPEAVPVNFDSLLGEIRYDAKPAEGLRVTPRLNLKLQLPWWSATEASRDLEQNPDYEGVYAGLYENKRMVRVSGSVATIAEPLPDLTLTFGPEVYVEQGHAQDADARYYDGSADVMYWSAAVFGEGTWRSAWANLSAGARADYHSAASFSLVPRVSLTKAWERWHAKLLLSRAYRAPAIANVDSFTPRDPESEAQIKPETTSVGEVELGYNLQRHLFVSGNLFYVRIDDPIVYYYEDADAYDNYPTVSTAGAEVELRYTARWLSLRASYAYYQAVENQVDQYAALVPGEVLGEANALVPGALLAVPQHKATVLASFPIWRKLSFNPSVVLLGDKLGFDGVVEVDGEETLRAGHYPAELLVNANLLWRDAWFQGLDLSLGVRNLLDTPVRYVQPYRDGWHAPMPGPGRELTLGVAFQQPL